MLMCLSSTQVCKCASMRACARARARVRPEEKGEVTGQTAAFAYIFLTLKPERKERKEILSQAFLSSCVCVNQLALNNPCRRRRRRRCRSRHRRRL